MYCNTVAITFRMYTVCISVYTVCIQCVYSVYTTILQLQRSCWHSYSQLIIQLSCNFKNTVNTAEFRIHTIILQLHTQLTPLIYNHITLYIQCNYRVRVYSIHTSSVVTLSYSILTTLLQLLTPRFSHSYSDLQLFFNCNTVDWHPPTQ